MQVWDLAKEGEPFAVIGYLPKHFDVLDDIRAACKFQMILKGNQMEFLPLDKIQREESNHHEQL